VCDRRFPAQYRLRRESEFRRAFNRRCTAADEQLVVFAYPNELPHPRLGIIVTRRQGKAVVRNRWKRLLREAFRLSKTQIPSGVDFVVIARGSQRPKLETVRRSLVRLAQRAAKKALAPTVNSPESISPKDAATENEP